MTCLNIQLASEGTIKLGIWLWAPTCQDPPSGNWIRSLHHRQWEHLSTYTVQSFLLFTSPEKSSLSGKYRSISLHSMDVIWKGKSMLSEPETVLQAHVPVVLGPCIAWHQGLTAVPQVMLEYSIKAILSFPKAEDTFLSWGPALARYTSPLNLLALPSLRISSALQECRNAHLASYTGKTSKQAASPTL